MKALIFSTGLFLIITSHAFSQCDAASLDKIPGKWIIKQPPAISGASAYGFPRTQVPALLKNMDQYLIPLKNFAPQPLGMDILWYKIIGFRPLFPGGPQPNFVQTYFEKYSCQNGKQYRDDRKAAEILIESNYFFSFMTNANSDPDSYYNYNGKPIMIMPFALGTVQGFPYFKAAYEGSDVQTHHRTVLLAMPGKLPYHILTRREVLEFMNRQLDNEKQKMMIYLDKTKIRSKADQEAEKQKEINFYKENYPDDQNRVARYLANYKTDEQKKEEQKKKAEQKFTVMYDRIREVTKKYERELDSPALLLAGNLHYGTIDANWDFTPGKEKDDHLCTWNCRHGTQFAVLNESYFDKKLSRAIPQFITVTFNLTVSDGNKFRDPFYEQLREDWKNTFDFAKLIALLGK